MKILVFLGSMRISTPPHPKRLGERVALACLNRVRDLGADVELIDPVNYPLDPAFKPHFAYAASKAPAELDSLAKKIITASGYIMVSPEYNHSMSPALANLLNHFGSSLFSYKPSAIATYSAGQWGGARAAVNMRTYLSELGCLPVSSMIHIPHAQDVFDEAGGYFDTVNDEHWTGYLDRTLKQLLWWSEAASTQRQQGKPTNAFTALPTQRNAP